MKKLFMSVALMAGLFSGIKAQAGTSSLWQQISAGNAPSKELLTIHPVRYQVFTLNESWLKLQMFSLSTNPGDAIVIDLPLPDGSYRSFRVWQDPMMHPQLAAKYPEIKTFTGTAVDDQRVTAKLDFTIYGFHAMIFDGENTSFVDPYDLFHDGFYMAHYKRDEVRELKDKMKCEFRGEHEISPAGEAMETAMSPLPKMAARTVNGWNLHTYELALCANHFYCQAATGSGSPTMTACLSAMTTSMNRVNGVYERDFSVHMNFVANEDTLIWPTNTGSINGTDPFGTTTINNNGSTCLGICQTQCTNRIGSANFDLGHVFTTGGGGISGLGIVCTNSQKGKSCTGSPTPVGDGYDIDYIAHEMGHEFGSEHTFNNDNDGSCGGNAVNSFAYEPGSGTTIMAYAGICPPDDLTMHSQDYFHASSLVQIVNKLNGSEASCATNTTTGNKLVALSTFSTSYNIPYKTPFELTAPTAVDSVADTATTYCWEQWNLGDFGKRFVNTYLKGPLFRSYAPVKSQTRVFPRIGMVTAGVLSNAGSEGNQGEKVPDTARYLTFKLTVRAILAGKGTFVFPDDTIHLNAIQTATRTGFKVTSQNTTGITYNGGTTQTITWDKVGTDAAPVSAATVDIYVSKDGGNTWPYLLGTFSNTGTASVTMPNPAATTSQARVKVKGHNNVFFNVNMNNFTISHNSSLPTTGVTPVASALSDVKVYPVPATETLHINAGATGITAAIYNTIGQCIWQGTVNGTADISVNNWAKGVYHLQIISEATGERVVKSIVVE